MLSRGFVLTATAVCLALLAVAQDNYEIQVYAYDTVPAKSTMVELHSNFTVDGSKTVSNGVLPTNHAEHETIEITHGVKDWAEVGFYFFNSQNPGRGMQFVGSHIRPRVTVPKSWNWPVGVSISQEFGWAKTAYSEDDWSYELRPIIDKQVGKTYLSLNPTFEHALHGPNAANGFEFTPNVNLGYDVTEKANLALEYYGAVGHITDFDPKSAQQHQLFYALNYDFGPAWEFNIAYGVGLTGATDKSMVKMIIGRRQ